MPAGVRKGCAFFRNVISKSFGLCPPVCGKAVPFRMLDYFLRGCAAVFANIGGTAAEFSAKYTERHSLSAHQAAKPHISAL